MNNGRLLLASCVVLMALALAVPVHANIAYTVSMDTSAISGKGGYALAFQLNDGSGAGDGNNTVTLSNFDLGGGSAGACCTLLGGASGDLGSGVVLTDSSFFNSHAQAFTPGASLSFTLDLTTNVDAGGTPDLFGFSILSGGSAVATLDDLFGDMFLYVDIDSASPTVYRWAAADGSLSAPTLTDAAAVPEPGSALLMGTGLVGLVAVVRRSVKR